MKLPEPVAPLTLIELGVAPLHIVWFADATVPWLTTAFTVTFAVVEFADVHAPLVITAL